MKSKFLKMVIPAFAILLAIGISFATESINSSQIGYYDDPFEPGIEEVSTNCIKNGSGNLCKEGVYQLYDTPALNAGDELRQP
ncbi:DUF6520 family protein [Seonamhaeicola sp.]|uniref:DUF6520 family protein n=1 Tax=Seonamhaeicola sp. TaxID=1912245 RepID=UPI002612B4D3|nr:DUF6520 family protein [Seonamhaeicola sp.]